MEELYFVYWYKLPTHTDPFKEGYIGVTNNMHRRDKEHRRNKKVSHFTNALTLHDTIFYEVLHIVSKSAALQLENSYRPNLSIGWNYAVGGKDILTSVQSRPITLYHKDSWAITHTYKSITEAAKATGTSGASIRTSLYRKSYCYNTKGWAILHASDFDRSTTMTVVEATRKALTGLKRSKPSHFKGKTNRWTTEERARIGAQHKGKVISDKQRASMSAKNRLHNPQCRAVTLVHKDSPTVSHTYHSISEASRQLNLPLSRLKSKAQAALNRFGNDGWAITHLG